MEPEIPTGEQVGPRDRHWDKEGGLARGWSLTLKFDRPTQPIIKIDMQHIWEPSDMRIKISEMT